MTLTVGGNDLDVAGLATLCPAEPTDCITQINLSLSTQLPMLGTSLVDLYDEVAKAAPEARIVVTGYPHLFGRAPGLIDAVNKSTDALHATIEQAVTVAQAADVNIRYVDVTEGLRDTASSVTSPSSMRPVYPRRFHPNAAGHDVCFDAISASLPTGWVDKQKQLE